MDLFPFKFFVGVVEDIHDPLKAGRVRVRIFGYHTDDKTVLPTSDLSWSVPIMPITRASMSGKGTTPIGLVSGSWVTGFFLDTDMQQTAVFGTFSGMTPAAGDIKNTMKVIEQYSKLPKMSVYSLVQLHVEGRGRQVTLDNNVDTYFKYEDFCNSYEKTGILMGI